MRRVLGVVVAALTTSGCATLSAMDVGAVRVSPSGYREVQLTGSTLQIQYKSVRHVERSNATIEDTPDLWTIVPFESLPWVSLDLYAVPPDHEVPRDCSAITSKPDPAPAMTLHAYRFPFKGWYSPDAPDYEAPIAAYVEREDSRRLILVRTSSGDGGRVVASLLAVRSCRYNRPWAPYARAALVPFAVVVDIITVPFQILFVATLTSIAAMGK